MSKKKPKQQSNTIAQNRKVRHDYFIEEKFEAGLALQGWEVKSLRGGSVNLTDTYVFVKDNEAWLIGTNITPLNTVSTHYVTEPTRTRKLLLNARELKRIESTTKASTLGCSLPIQRFVSRKRCIHVAAYLVPKHGRGHRCFLYCSQ